MTYSQCTIEPVGKTMSTGNNPDGAIIVDILEPLAPNTGNWNPIVGPETRGLTLPPGSNETIIEEARRVLRRCVPPMTPATNQTGLVVGYVQSGKTMSFTTLAALARDNGYQMVIVIAGTYHLPLLSNRGRELLQTYAWIDREVVTHGGTSTNRGFGMISHIAVQDTLAEWEDNSVPVSERRTVLITVMKHHGRASVSHRRVEPDRLAANSHSHNRR